MKAIDILKEEHKVIIRMLKVIRNLSFHTFNTKNVYYEGFYQSIDFIKNYADKLHHGKEEDILFDCMPSELGENIKMGPIYGMLAEHDYGRLYIKTLEEALKSSQEGKSEANVFIVSNAICYTDLLYRHIDKEDHAIFTFAAERLSKEALRKMNHDFEAAEEKLNSIEVENKYLKLLYNLEKYVDKL